jgi:cytochrome oxidase Cu insertion factor (SCO1/SenC/PrrC family)
VSFTGIGIQHNGGETGRMKAKTFLLRLTLFVPFLAFQAVVGLTAEAKKEKAPEFVLTTFDNKKISLSDFQGRPILLKFIASW